MILAFRRSNVVGMNATQRKLLRFACERIDLVDPALYRTGGGIDWWLFDDHRITYDEIAIIGRLCALLGSLGDFNTREELRAHLRQTVVLAKDVVFGADPFQSVLDANGAPVWVRAGDVIPSGLTPV